MLDAGRDTSVSAAGGPIAAGAPLAIRWDFPLSSKSWPAKIVYTLIFFALIEGAVFHSGFYRSLIQPESTTGYMEDLILNELGRQKTSLRQILAVGDSRMPLRPKAADEAGMASGFQFATIALGGTSPRTWYYALRAVDPDARRYDAILIPSSDFEEAEQYDYLDDRDVDLHYIAARIRLADAWEFASSFHDRQEGARALVQILFKSTLFRRDFQELIVSPKTRLKRVAENRAGSAGWSYNFKGDEASLSGLRVIDWETREIYFPPQITPHQRELVNRVYFGDRPARNGRATAYHRLWYGKLIERYRGSATKLIFFRVPRAAVPIPQERYAQSAIRNVRGPHVIVLPEETFQDLERPELFGDPLHMNAAGMAEFSRRLAAEVIRILGVPRP